MSDEQTRKVIDQFNQAFQQHDPSLLKDLLAENCRLENSGPVPTVPSTSATTNVCSSGAPSRATRE